MAILIPFWYYQFGSVIYMLAAFVGVLLSYYSYKLYELGSTRTQLLFHSGFVFITAGLFAMALGNLYGYINFTSCQPICEFNQVDLTTYAVIKFANYGYYAASIIGYGLIALSYMKTRRKLLLPLVSSLGIDTSTFVMFPFMNSYFQLFQVIAILILSYICMKTIHNYNTRKNKYSLHVMLGFVFIAAFHLLMFLLPFSRAFFALAHFSMLFGFGSLLYMLIQVNKHERT
ncbi:hypothetical protein EPN87_03030 [archaeon]|nr:MAG: hypothetical protein EPN87_03030 [archaeon]